MSAGPVPSDGPLDPVDSLGPVDSRISGLIPGQDRPCPAPVVSQLIQDKVSISAAQWVTGLSLTWGHSISMILRPKVVCYQIEVKLRRRGRSWVPEGWGHLFSATCWGRLEIDRFCREPETRRTRPYFSVVRFTSF